MNIKTAIFRNELKIIIIIIIIISRKRGKTEEPVNIIPKNKKQKQKTTKS